MLKKRTMAKARWVDDLEFYNPIKSLATGYAENQPRWPYWVQPVNYSRKEWDEMGTWMITTLGNGNWMTEHGLWVGSDRKYWFRKEADRTMFLLKWS